MASAIGDFATGLLTGAGAVNDIAAKYNANREFMQQTDFRDQIAEIAAPQQVQLENGAFGYDPADVARYKSEVFNLASQTYGVDEALKLVNSISSGMMEEYGMNLQNAAARIAAGDYAGAAPYVDAAYSNFMDGSLSKSILGEDGMLYSQRYDLEGNPVGEPALIDESALAKAATLLDDPYRWMAYDLSERQFQHNVMVDFEKLDIARTRAAGGRGGRGGGGDENGWDASSVEDMMEQVRNTASKRYEEFINAGVLPEEDPRLAAWQSNGPSGVSELAIRTATTNPRTAVSHDEALLLAEEMLTGGGVFDEEAPVFHSDRGYSVLVDERDWSNFQRIFAASQPPPEGE